VSDTLDRVQRLVRQRRVEISDHGYDELADDGILAHEAIAGVGTSVLVEDYPSATKGPSVLVLEHDSAGQPIHVVWGIPAGGDGPAVLITAYRPDPARWSADYKVRVK